MVVKTRSQKRIRVSVDAQWSVYRHVSQPHPDTWLKPRWHRAVDKARDILGRRFDIFTAGRFPREDVEHSVIRVLILPCASDTHSCVDREWRRLAKLPNTYMLVPNPAAMHPAVARVRGFNVVAMPALSGMQATITAEIVADAVRLVCRNNN